MSELKTNKISTNDGNNVAIDNSLNLKSYGTTARNALTSAAGDMIYNSDDAKVQVYNGSSWEDLGGAAIEVEYLIVAGGGAGGGGGINWTTGGGAGAGGLRNSYASENTGGGLSGELALQCTTGVNYAVSVGGGGAGVAGYQRGGEGTNSYFAHITAIGGGGGGTYTSFADIFGGSGGSTGSYYNANTHAYSGQGVPGQGFNRGNGIQIGTNTNQAGGGGGGAAAVGSAATNGNGGDGGAGLSSSITGSATSYAGGGGGAGYSSGGSGGAGGGSAGSNNSGGTASAATVNTGGGGGGSTTTNNSANNAGGAGGSGVVILRYPDTFTLAQTGLTTSNINTAIGGTSDKYTTITGGTGTISFS